MKRSIVAAMLGVLGVAIPAVAGAGQLDHLLCYRVKDPLDIKTYVNLLAEKQPEFSQKECVVTKAIEFCVPATKKVIDSTPVNGLMGPPLQMDYVCYNLECPHAKQPPDKLVTDQFGQRIQRKYRPVKLCVPARKEPVPCGPIGKRQCGGTCPNPDESCSPDEADKGCVCRPPPKQECGFDAAGVCSGPCPPTATGETQECKVNAAGKCECEKPAPCDVNADGVCSGTCPNPTDECRASATAPCACQPAQKPCGLNDNRLCGGPCPNPADECKLNAADQQCACQSTTVLCTPSAPTCGGVCPAPQVCRPLQVGANVCSCQ